MREIKIMSFVVAAAILIHERGVGQDSDAPYFHYPQVIAPSSHHHLLRLSMARLPEDELKDDSPFRAPIFEYKALYGFPGQFSIAAGANTNIATFHVSLGPRWHSGWDRLRFGIGYDVALWFGHIKGVEGFDASFSGWLNYPNISVGYRFEKVTLTLLGELIFAMGSKSSVGDLEVPINVHFMNGYSIALYVEQPLWKDNYVLIGIKNNYVRLYYPLWALFSTFDRFVYVPEITFGFVL